MRSIDWLQLVLYVGALALITKPMGLYLVRVLDAQGRTWLDPIIKPFERLTYRLMGVKSDREQDWKEDAFAMLLFSLVSCLFTYGILRLQHLLPLNPQAEEHTSELQSLAYLVCRLLLEKKTTHEHTNMFGPATQHMHHYSARAHTT